MTEEMEIAIIIESAGLASFGGILIGLWHDIKGKKLPEFETTSSPDNDEKPVQTKKNMQERGAFVVACGVLAAMLGILIALFYLGFMPESMPNRYGRAFISISAGFLMPQVLSYSETLSIQNLIDRFFK